MTCGRISIAIHKWISLSSCSQLITYDPNLTPAHTEDKNINSFTTTVDEGTFYMMMRMKMTYIALYQQHRFLFMHCHSLSLGLHSLNSCTCTHTCM